MNIELPLTTTQIVDLLRGSPFEVTRPRLAEWVRLGYISPSVRSPGPGRSALFNMRQIYAIALFSHMMSNFGFSRDECGMVTQHFQDTLAEAGFGENEMIPPNQGGGAILRWDPDFVENNLPPEVLVSTSFRKHAPKAVAFMLNIAADNMKYRSSFSCVKMINIDPVVEFINKLVK